MKISATAGNFSWLLTKEELVQPKERPDDAVRIAQAIWQRTDPEWRELIEQEQQGKYRIASWLFRVQRCRFVTVSRRDGKLGTVEGVCVARVRSGGLFGPGVSSAELTPYRIAQSLQTGCAHDRPPPLPVVGERPATLSFSFQREQ